MSQELVSVVIPTFNYGHLVCEAVDSVLSQTYSPIEVIVVDDGSTDDTREKLASYGDRIRYHYQSNAGLAAARNTGIRLSKGNLIAFLDSDDVFHSRKLEIQVEWMSRDKSIDLCATECISDTTLKWRAISPTIESQTISLCDLVQRSRFGSCGVVARKRCFEGAGLFDPTLKSAEDRDMWIRIAAKYRIVKLLEPLWWYRPTPGSMSRNAAKMEHFEREVLEKAFAMPEMRGQRLLRRRAMGLASLAAARRYQAAGDFRRAFDRLLKSVVTWPLPFTASDGVAVLGRPRLGVAMLRQVLGLSWGQSGK